MKQKEESKNINGVVVKLVMLGTFILSGCSSSYENGNFDHNGMPKKEYLVGGGFGIEWVAPSDGTLYLTEEKISPGKILMTKALKSGEEFEATLGPDEIKEVYGDIEMSKLKFSLYFIPQVKISTIKF